MEFFNFNIKLYLLIYCLIIFVDMNFDGSADGINLKFPHSTT